jgi:hypothetical protein
LEEGGILMVLPHIIKVYVVFTTIDDWGRHGERLGIFSTPEDAIQCAKGQGWYGGNGDIVEKWAIEDCSMGKSGTYYLLSGSKDHPPIPIDLDLKKKTADEELRAKTLAALTPDQKRVLGIK